MPIKVVLKQTKAYASHVIEPEQRYDEYDFFNVAFV